MTRDRRLGPLRWVLAALLLTVPAPAVADHAAGEETVVVQANAFQPSQVELAPGGTVTWQVLQSGHTITADDGRFDFRSDAGGTLDAGASRSFTVGDTEEVIRYRCTIHSGMRGAIVVGHPEPVVYPTPTIRVPEDITSIGEAVAAAPDWGRVEIAPGTYAIDEPIVADGTGVTITGTGAAPTDVTIVGGTRTPSSAFVVTGSHVTVANLGIVRMGRVGVHVTGADAAAVVDVVIDGARSTREGVLIEDTTGAAVIDSSIQEVRRAGVRIEPCTACGVVVAGTHISDSFAGVIATGARGVRVVDSTITANAVGVVARAEQGRATTIEVRANTITDNVARDMVPAIDNGDRLLAVGAGVWLAGITSSTVTANTVTGHGYGIVVAAGPATTTTIAGNQLGDHSDADLAWDGAGADVCFADNGATATSEPSDIHTLYPCDRPTVGVPYPLVNLRLLLHAAEEPTP